jgi:hypothetical protein
MNTPREEGTTGTTTGEATRVCYVCLEGGADVSNVCLCVDRNMHKECQKSLIRSSMREDPLSCPACGAAFTNVRVTEEWVRVLRAAPPSLSLVRKAEAPAIALFAVMLLRAGDSQVAFALRYAAAVLSVARMWKTRNDRVRTACLFAFLRLLPRVIV